MITIISKRITLLKRKKTMPAETFRAHWAGPHAEIAKHLPGLIRYNQNHVTASSVSGDDADWPVHGFVELWFRDRSAVAEAAQSTVTQQLIIDEPYFLDGLTGLGMDESSLYEGPLHKIFILGRATGDAAIRVAENEMQKALASLLGCLHCEIGRVVNVMRRDTLWSDPEPPSFVSFASFATPEQARHAFERSRASIVEASPFDREPEIYLTEEIRIV